MQLDQLAPDPEPLGIAVGKLGEEHEQLPGVTTVSDRVLDPDRARELLGAVFVDLLRDQPGDREHLLGLGQPLPPGRHSGHGLELFGQCDLNFPRFRCHADLDESRPFRSTMLSTSPGPTCASTLPASAVSTVHTNVSPVGARGARQRTETRTVIASWPSVKPHSRSLPGIAWLSSIAHASSTAMRMSSISSSVKSSRAASPAVAVRNTDRYAPSAGILTLTLSLTASTVWLPDELATSSVT